MHDTPAVYQACSELLRREKESIMARWEERAKREVKAAARTARLVLRDDLPQVIDDLAQGIAEARDELDPQEAENSIDRERAAVHGEERAETPAYTAGQVLHEFAILRQVLIAELARAGPDTPEIAEAVTRAVEQAGTDAVDSFVYALQQRQNKLMGAVAHDIRNPLFVASANVYLLQTGAAPDPAPMIEKIKINIDRAVRMLDGLLDTSRVEAGKGIPMRLESVDLGDLVRTTCEEVALTFPNEIDADIPDEPLPGEFDPGVVRRVVENLVTNAAHYGEPEGPIRVGLREEGDYLVLTVANRGEPIPPEEQRTMFQFFTRGEGRARDPHRQWGLGLALVRMVADAHQGEASVTSTQAGGTTFTVRLRRDLEPAAARMMP